MNLGDRNYTRRFTSATDAATLSETVVIVNPEYAANPEVDQYTFSTNLPEFSMLEAVELEKMVVSSPSCDSVRVGRLGGLREIKGVSELLEGFCLRTAQSTETLSTYVTRTETLSTDVTVTETVVSLGLSKMSKMTLAMHCPMTDESDVINQ